MGVGAGLYMYVVVVQKFTFAISSPDEFLYVGGLQSFRRACKVHCKRSAGTQTMVTSYDHGQYTRMKNLTVHAR